VKMVLRHSNGKRFPIVVIANPARPVPPTPLAADLSPRSDSASHPA
jgi:hypothetical protein